MREIRLNRKLSFSVSLSRLNAEPKWERREAKID